MSIDAEEAAGRELREKSFPMQPFSVKWEDLKPEIRSEWIRDAMDIVRAYQSKAWREPTALDLEKRELPEHGIRERKPMLVTYSYDRLDGKWSPWAEPRVNWVFSGSTEFDAVRVQDLPPLPEPKL